jgi:hypothetical protein
MQALAPGACLRGAVARSCDVRGCLLVPLFPHADRGLIGPVAVLELVQHDADVYCFPALFNWLLEKLPVRPHWRAPPSPQASVLLRSVWMQK